jgi:uncharacterized protein YndB with AHSA1/START domain
MIEVVTTDDRIVVHAKIEAPRESVWQALTEEEHIAKWWGGYVSLEACQGGSLTDRWTDDRGREVLTSGEVLWLTAPEMLELTWADDDWDTSTRVLFELAQVDEATHLTLTHSGWEALPSSRREELIREHASGWSRHMANMEAHLRGTLG